jgi:hypothetical protein
MQKSIVAVVSLIVFVAVEEQIKKDVVVMVSYCQHQRGSAKHVGLWAHAFLEKHSDHLALAVACCQMQNIHALFCCYLFID